MPCTARGEVLERMCLANAHFTGLCDCGLGMACRETRWGDIPRERSWIIVDYAPRGYEPFERQRSTILLSIFMSAFIAILSYRIWGTISVIRRLNDHNHEFDHDNEGTHLYSTNSVTPVPLLVIMANCIDITFCLKLIVL